MKGGPAAAADWVIANFPLVHEPINLEELIVQIGQNKSWFLSDEQAQESAESWLERFAKRLANNVDDARRRGRPTRYDFNSSNPDLIQGSSFVESGDSKELVAAKRSRIFMDEYLMLSQKLTGREFEAACRGMLDLMGCEDPVLTPRSNDQGLDFYGLLQMVNRLNARYTRGSIDRSMRSWIIGQAKQVGNPVGTPEIRELTGSIEMARYGISADNGKSHKSLDLKPYDSVFLLFITTGEFTRDAWRIIDSAGLVAMDGPVVAAFLCDHCVADLEGRCDSETFDEWIRLQLGDKD